jgi:hypothetical protein
MKPFKHFASWARVVASVVVLASVVAAVFFGGFFTEREYGDVLPVLENYPLSLVSGDTCIERVCTPAGRFGQHCRQVIVPC